MNKMRSDRLQLSYAAYAKQRRENEKVGIVRRNATVHKNLTD